MPIMAGWICAVNTGYQLNFVLFVAQPLAPAPQKDKVSTMMQIGHLPHG